MTREIVKAPIAPKEELAPMAYASVEACVKSLGKIVQGHWVYPHPLTGHIDLLVIRVQKNGEKKQYYQGHQTDRGIILKKPPGPALLPLYRRDIILTAKRVVVVEGEKCADALIAIGIPATTASGGAGMAALTDWSLLAGKQCDLWPDNDATDLKTGKNTGRDHMKEVAGLLERVTPSPVVRILDLDGLGLPPKGDVADLLEAMDAQEPEGCRATIYSILDDADDVSPSAEVGKKLEDIISGKWSCAPWPWAQMTQMTKALLPGTVTILCGSAGSTKSFFTLQCLSYWHKHKTTFSIYELEDDREYHLRRLLAQETGNSSLFDDEWIRANPEPTRAAFLRGKPYLDEIGVCISQTPDEQLTLKALAEWVRCEAKAGKRVIVIDPITAANTENKPWAEDLLFMMSIKKSARDYGASVILVTHPKKGSGKGKAVDMDDIAGGAAYQRFAHTILYLEAFDSQPMAVAVPDRGSVTLCMENVNRSIKICKARNGRGAGMTLAFHFDGGSLRFFTLGLLQKPHKGDGSQERKKQSGPSRFEKITSKPHSSEGIF